MSSLIVCKSVFEIRPSNKKSVTVAFLVNKNISIIIQFECKLSKKTIILDLEKWCILLTETNYNMIFENIHSRCKPVILCKNFSYSVNFKHSSISLRADKNCITLSLLDLYRLKQLQDCIDSVILEKQKKLVMYQQCFNFVYNLITKNVKDLPLACRRNDFLSRYIQDYNFDFSNTQFDDLSFIFEIQQYHYVTLSNLILKDLELEVLT